MLDAGVHRGEATRPEIRLGIPRPSIQVNGAGHLLIAIYNEKPAKASFIKVSITLCIQD
jgi:hypothetical protein